MDSAIIVDWIALAATAAAAAAAGSLWLIPRRSRTASAGPGSNSEPAVFLFDGDRLIDATRAARRHTGLSEDAESWTSLAKALDGRFPDFPDDPADMGAEGEVTIPAGDPADDATVVCEAVDGVTRVELRDAAAGPGAGHGGHETELLRNAIEQAPYPVWRVDSKGTVRWRNAAYDALSKKVFGDSDDDKDRPPLFPSAGDAGAATRKTRTGLTVAGRDRKLWFDVSVTAQGDGFWCFATDINAVVDAETAQRNFVQTLAKTFAQLSIGLAIFDRNRQLALFNPALIDLTSLPADFLSARPTLLSFFDRLRDQRMMPEPKNYGSWRHQMAELVAAAADGRYQETWTLPSGAVYSVTGRPHPDGAVAFLFEDITAEITLTRRFRTDLEVQQSVMDQLDQAIAVFSESGNLVLTNAAYRRLWKVDPEASFVQMTVLDAMRTWQARSEASPVFGDIRDFVTAREGRAEWWARLRLKTGAALTCGIRPVHNGATMVSFELDGPGAMAGAELPAPESARALPGA